jgi:hypothetical protein
LAVSSQRSRVMAGSSPAARARRSAGGGLAAGDLVGEDELEELGVAHAGGVGEREPFGERVEAAAQLHPVQQSLELWSEGRRVHRACPARSGCLMAKCSASRANRPAITVPGNAGWIALGSVPRSSMRPINPTLTTS